MVTKQDVQEVLNNWTEYSNVQNAIDELAEIALAAIREREALVCKITEWADVLECDPHMGPSNLGRLMSIEVRRRFLI
jgi:hypothetical protein